MANGIGRIFLRKSVGQIQAEHEHGELKRSLGAKDWGTMIEGHGGALDRMDSVSFAAPLFFHLVNYYYTV